MTARFHLQLVNDRFGDPGLFVDFAFEKRALLFDIGDISALPARKLLRVSDVFVSHMHMDHFCGFDQLLRLLLCRDRTLRLFGPQGLIAAVGHKLAAYSWNLVDRFSTDLVFVVTEWQDQRRRSATFRLKTGFRPEETVEETAPDGILLDDEGFKVEALTLDHGIPVLAFALNEGRHVNVWRNRVTERGLDVGPWLVELKAAILRGDPDDHLLAVAVADDSADTTRQMPLGELRSLVNVIDGLKIVYVVDAAPSDANIERILAFAAGASHLCIETPFLHADIERARDRNHLTARLAGEIAARAGVENLITQHYSPRYEGRGAELMEEAEAAFRGLAPATIQADREIVG